MPRSQRIPQLSWDQAVTQKAPSGNSSMHALLALSVAFLLASAASAALPTATVLSIGDGDTLRVRQGGRAITIRLACIDAPETAQSPWGQQARRHLQQHLPIGRTVSLDVKTTDRYGRTVAEVISDININLVLVEDGQAFAYRQYMDGCDAKEYLDAEYRASRRRYGIWQVPGGITRPWDYRRTRRPGSGLPSAGGSFQPSAPPGSATLTSRPIGSWSEAQALLRQGHSYLDGDGDGVVCKSLWG